MVYFTIRSFLFNSEIYCPFSLQEFLRYNPFERTIVAGLLSRLCVSHKLLVKKGYGNDTTKHFLSTLIELCTYGLDVNVQAFWVLTQQKGWIWPHSQYPIFDCLQYTNQGEWKAYISITSLWKKLLLRTKTMSTKNVFPQLGGRGRPFP